MIYKKNLTLVQRRAVSPQIFSTSSWRLFKLIYKRFVSDLPVWSKLQKQTMMLNFLHAITASLFNYFNYQCKVISSNYLHIFKQLIEILLKNNKVTIPNLWMAPGSVTIIKIVNIYPINKITSYAIEFNSIWFNHFYNSYPAHNTHYDRVQMVKTELLVSHFPCFPWVKVIRFL